MEKKTTLFNHSLTWGVIFGIVSIIVSLLFWFLNIMPSNLLIILALMLINLALSVIFVVIGVKKYRDGVLGGKISFGNAFLTGFLIIIIASILLRIYNVIFNTAIDPQYFERTIQATKDWTTEFMTRSGAPDEQIEKSLRKFDEKANPSVFEMFRQGWFGTVFFGAVISLIIAAILKKDEPILMSAET